MARLMLLLTLFLVALSSCSKGNEYAPPPPPPVTVAAPIAQQVSPVDHYTGRLDAVETVEIRARVKGFLRERSFNPGDLVREGQLLFLIEQEPFIAAANAAKARLEQTQAAAKLAQITYERNKEAFELGGTSSLELRTREAELEQANAVVLEAEAALDTSKLDLDYTQIRSPINGRITESMVDLGNLVGSGDSTLLAKVVDDTTIYAFFDVPELTLLEYLRKTETKRDNSKRGTQSVGILLADANPYTRRALVDYIDPEVNTQTGTVRVRASVSNPETLLFPGMFVRIEFADDPIDTLLVPDAAIQRDLAGAFLLTVGAGDIVARTPIEIGQVYDGMRSCLSGLSPDARVIVNGAQRARVGSKVAPQQAEPAATQARPPTTTPAG